MQQFRETIENLFKEFSELDEIVKVKNALIKDRKANLKDLTDGKTIEELEDVLTYMYVDSILQNRGLQVLFTRLMHYIDLYKTLHEEPLSEDVEKYYKEMRQWLPKPIFKAINGELVEYEEGVLEKERKLFLESEELKILKERFTKN